MLDTTLSYQDYLVLERFMTLVSNNHHNLNMAFMEVFPRLFPDAELPILDIPEMFRFRFNQSYVESLLDVIRSVVETAAELS